MTNAEKYKEEIQRVVDNDFICDFIRVMILKHNDECSVFNCPDCHLRMLLWMMKEEDRNDSKSMRHMQKS